MSATTLPLRRPPRSRVPAPAPAWWRAAAGLVTWLSLLFVVALRGLQQLSGLLTSTGRLTGLPDLDGYDYCLNAGGDVVAAVGPAALPAWRVGVEERSERSRLVVVRAVRTGGSTSGSAVTGPSLRWADVFATAAFARGGDVESWVRSRAPGYEDLAAGRDP